MEIAFGVWHLILDANAMVLENGYALCMPHLISDAY